MIFTMVNIARSRTSQQPMLSLNSTKSVTQYLIVKDTLFNTLPTLEDILFLYVMIFL